MIGQLRQKLELWLQYSRLGALQKKIGYHWSGDKKAGGVIRRQYRDHSEYVEHQRSKLDFILAKRPKWIRKYNERLERELSQRLSELPIKLEGRRVLCLGARLGAEVRAFLERGAFAVGIDLNPGKNNPYVIYGDFHHLPFPSESVDILYTNSFDHVHKVDEWMAEMRRVLSDQGRFIVEAVDGSEQRDSVGFYESLWWSDVRELAALFEKHGFKLEREARIEFPYPGSCFVFRP